MNKKSLIGSFVVVITALSVSVSAQMGVGPKPTPDPLPMNGFLATFQAGTETFNALITDPTAMNDALLLWKKKSNKRIPTGALACTQTTWNKPWHWHMIPSTVRFGFGAIEICDGTPSYVEQHCPTFGLGSYCPWQTVMIQLRDCRLAGCPAIAR
jgi:hypothetical protein